MFLQRQQGRMAGGIGAGRRAGVSSSGVEIDVMGGGEFLCAEVDVVVCGIRGMGGRKGPLFLLGREGSFNTFNSFSGLSACSAVDTKF